MTLRRLFPTLWRSLLCCLLVSGHTAGLEGGAEGALRFRRAVKAHERDGQVEQAAPVPRDGLRDGVVAVHGRLKVPALAEHVAQVEVRLRAWVLSLTRVDLAFLTALASSSGMKEAQHADYNGIEQAYGEERDATSTCWGTALMAALNASLASSCRCSAHSTQPAHSPAHVSLAQSRVPQAPCGIVCHEASSLCLRR